MSINQLLLVMLIEGFMMLEAVPGKPEKPESAE